MTNTVRCSKLKATQNQKVKIFCSYKWSECPFNLLQIAGLNLQSDQSKASCIILQTQALFPDKALISHRHKRFCGNKADGGQTPASTRTRGKRTTAGLNRGGNALSGIHSLHRRKRERTKKKSFAATTSRLPIKIQFSALPE